MTELGIYYCYAYRKDGRFDTACFQGAPIKASVDAQHWADDRIRQTAVYSRVDARDALGRLIYSR